MAVASAVISLLTRGIPNLEFDCFILHFPAFCQEINADCGWIISVELFVDVAV